MFLESKPHAAFTFRSFVAGVTNQFAATAICGMARATRVYETLVLYGCSGVGKTHLLHALANQVERRRPSIRILLVSGELFVSDAASMTRSELLARYSHPTDLLLVDGIEALLWKPRSQQRLLEAIRALRIRSRPIVLTAGVLPSEVAFKETLRRAMCDGLVAEVESLDLDTARRIARRQLAVSGFRASSPALDYIAAAARGNAFVLQGMVHRIALTAELRERRVTRAHARAILRLRGP